jgi:hypothetical protein
MNPSSPETIPPQPPTKGKQTGVPVLKIRRETVVLPPALAERLGREKWRSSALKQSTRNIDQGSKRS